MHREHRRISPVFLGIAGGHGGRPAGRCGPGSLGATGFAVFLFVVAGWIVSLCLHEYAHARTALHSGDISIEARRAI